MTDRELFQLAARALDNAYAPYSHFQVGACLLSKDGRTFSGCNIENASYGAAICAERCAVSCAVSQGVREFEAIAVAGRESFAWPCGICRQFLREFCDPKQMKVYVARTPDDVLEATLEDMMPHSFGPEDLIGDVPGV